MGGRDSRGPFTEVSILTTKEKMKERRKFAYKWVDTK